MVEGDVILPGKAGCRDETFNNINAFNMEVILYGYKKLTNR